MYETCEGECCKATERREARLTAIAAAEREVVAAAEAWCDTVASEERVLCLMRVASSVAALRRAREGK